jgi:hypothetical protein
VTINDIPLTQCSRAIHNNEIVLDRLTRDGKKEELRDAYKRILEAAFHAINRLDKL